jgi:hypothetical protein
MKGCLVVPPDPLKGEMELYKIIENVNWTITIDSTLRKLRSLFRRGAGGEVEKAENRIQCSIFNVLNPSNNDKQTLFLFLYSQVFGRGCRMVGWFVGCRC